MPWEAIAYVSSGLTLVAFIVATGAWLFKIQTEGKRKLIESADDEAKAGLVDKALDLVHVDTTGLTREQRYNLAMELIRRRAERFKIVALVVCVLAVTGGGVSIYSGFQIPENGNPLAPLIRDAHKLQAVAGAMSSGPLQKVRDVSSKAPKLAEDILDLDGIDKLPHELDQLRYAATVYLFASDASKARDLRNNYAEKAIFQAKKGLEMVVLAKRTDVNLSRKLSQLHYADKLRHIYLEAALTLVINEVDGYKEKSQAIVSDFDSEYFRTNIGDNFEEERRARLAKIDELWEKD